ncbi:hypothetical protein FHW67_003118 [Herbaspirillum sp. Sphag1AN]|uniref:MFS transporter n=1 Tax=unclassified Herbaspirillum TaxID=2624150 RepID=UPI00161BB03A|nr:hypothetical protein [Herbaspirillum sp. Sphag1AN]MBB3247014.1 hypothetical protein [Herbaspirillum sp. Sphag64]
MENKPWVAMVRFVVVALFFDALAPLLPYMADGNAISVQQFQSLLGACYLVFALSQLASASIIAVLGVYRAIALSSLSMSGVGLVMCLAEDAMVFSSMFLTLFACNGVGANATRVALRTASSEAGFKRLLAWITGAVEIKQMAMPVVVAAITAAFGWRWALAALVLPVLLVGGWMQLMPRQWPAAQANAVTSGWIKIASTRTFLMPTLIAAAFEIGFSPVSARLPFILSTELALSPLMTGLVLSCSSAAVAAGLLISGYLATSRSSRSLINLGLLLLCTGLCCTVAGTQFGWHYAVSGMIVMQTACGFIVIPCAADAINTVEVDRVRASALFGFVQPVVCGLAVAFAALIPGSGTVVALLMMALSLCLMVLLLAYRQ